MAKKIVVSETNMDKWGIECIGDFQKLDNVLLVHFKSKEQRKKFIDWLERVE